MQLLKHGAFFDDGWVAIEGGEPLPQGSDVIVGFERLVRDFDELKTHNGALGVAFENDRPVVDLEPYLDALGAVALCFPKFADGRAYSQCRQLRHRFGFRGEIRAVGNILPDQLAFMRGCGFDVFEVSEKHPPEIWQRAATAMTVAYQRGYAADQGFAPIDVLDIRKESYE